MSEAFLPGALFLLLLAALFVVIPLRRAYEATDSTRQAINKRVLKEQLNDLEQQHRDGVIDKQTLQSLRDELYEEAAGTLEGNTEKTAAAQQASWGLVGALLLLLVVGSVLLYQRLGAQQELELAALTEQLMTAQTAQQRDAAFEALVPALTSFLENKDHPQYRFLLAQAQTQQQDFAAATVNYKKLLDSDGESAELLALYAQSSYLSNDRKLTAEADAALGRALEINPGQRTALGLRGMSAFERGDYVQAVQSWQQLLATMPADSPQAQTIRQALANAQTRLPAASAAPAEDSAAQSITVRVDASDAAKRAGATVFVYARAANGPRMPLAIVRKSVDELPLTVTLDDSTAMMPAMKLSNFDQVEVLARVSVSGNAQTQSGDWQASSGVVKNPPESGPIELHIDTQVK
jgi:cytochrome c-type biogenesis protein CcmH